MFEWQGGEAVGAQHADSVVNWHGHIKPEEREGLLQTWQGLKATVEALPPVGQYTVASVAYRRCVGHFCPERKEHGLSVPYHTLCTAEATGRLTSHGHYFFAFMLNHFCACCK